MIHNLSPWSKIIFFLAITFFQKNQIAILDKNVSFWEFLNFIFSKNVIDLKIFIFYNYKLMTPHSRQDILKHFYLLKLYWHFFQNNIHQRSVSDADGARVRMYPVTNIFLFQHQRHPVVDASDKFYRLSDDDWEHGNLLSVILLITIQPCKKSNLSSCWLNCKADLFYVSLLLESTDNAQWWVYHGSYEKWPTRNSRSLRDVKIVIFLQNSKRSKLNSSVSVSL